MTVWGVLSVMTVWGRIQPERRQDIEYVDLCRGEEGGGIVINRIDDYREDREPLRAPGP
jgi:hypothetical protein